MRARILPLSQIFASVENFQLQLKMLLKTMKIVGISVILATLGVGAEMKENKPMYEQLFDTHSVHIQECRIHIHINYA